MDLDIDELIVEPGHFVVAPDKRFRLAGDGEGVRLDIFGDPDDAKRIYAAYARCYNNAAELIGDAEILFEAKRFARACALAITAWEELGKSQIAADYYSGVLTDIEYKAAFKEHRLKTAYLNRAEAIDGTDFLTVAYNTTIGHKLEGARQKALYASDDNVPSKEITDDNARDVINKVKAHLEYIRFAEDFNGRIGSKALFK
jgi:AbiV family abortive infection protein